MNKNLLGTLTQIKPSRSSLMRLNNILAMFEALVAETMTKAILGGTLGLSPSCIRKNIKVLQEAGVVPAFQVLSFAQEATYSVVNDEELIVEFANQLKAQIKFAENVLAGKTRWEDKMMSAKEANEAKKITKTRSFTCYEYQPGRRIYSSEGMSSIALKALSRQQMQIDPMRAAGLL